MNVHSSMPWLSSLRILIFAFNNERIIIKSSFIFIHRFLQITPQMLKYRSINALDDGKLSKILASLDKFGNLRECFCQNCLVAKLDFLKELEVT